MSLSYNFGNRQDLCRAIGKSILSALQNLTLSEPQLVANMVFQIPKAINTLNLPWIKSGGVFVHQHPQVRCAGPVNFPQATPNSVEIGDLLLLRKKQYNGDIISRSALLLQAKKKKLNGLSAHLDNENQHYLYTKWPSFGYVRATKALNGQNRHITGPGLNKAGKYLMIGQSRPCRFVYWRCCSYCVESCVFDRFCVLTAQPRLPFPGLARYKCFLEEMVNFIFGSAGKEYKKPPHRRDRNWNKVIEDLTTVTSKSISTYMNNASGSPNTQRGQYICFLSGDISVVLDKGLSKYENQTLQDVGSVPEVPDRNHRYDDEEASGISIIEFVVASDDEVDKYTR